MKSILDENVRSEITRRIASLTPQHTASWGKMSVFQMTKHCTYWNEWVHGTHKPAYRQEWLGKIFGRIALKAQVRDDSPMKKNMPAGSGFTFKEKQGDLEVEKLKWISLIDAYEQYSNPDFMHDFFGKMTDEQIGIFTYKHMDHHLRQFNV